MAVQPAAEKAQEDLTSVYKYLAGRSEEEVARLFSAVHTEEARGNGYKLKAMKFHLNTRKFFHFLSD